MGIEAYPLCWPQGWKRTMNRRRSAFKVSNVGEASILGTTENASRQHVEDQYRQLARQRHPDAGGSHDAMSELNAAREAALKAVAA